MDLTDTSTLIPLLQRYGLYTQKSFGQHFLVNREVLETIVEAAELGIEETVIEIGVGTGVLTRELADRVARVVGYEIDGNMEALLRETLGDKNNVTVQFVDFLQINLDSLPQPYKVVANLPYNVGSHIIDRLVSHAQPPTSITVLLQKEVAEKFVAEPPHGTYLGHFIRGYGRAEIVRRVSTMDFFPPPKVESAVLKIEREVSSVQVEDMRRFSGFLHKGFSQPRKKLNKVFGVDELMAAGIDPNMRAQEVGIEGWMRLFEVTTG